MAFMRSGVRIPSSPPIESMTNGGTTPAIFVCIADTFQNRNFDPKFPPSGVKPSLSEIGYTFFEIFITRNDLLAAFFHLVKNWNEKRCTRNEIFISINGKRLTRNKIWYTRSGIFTKFSGIILSVSEIITSRNGSGMSTDERIISQIRSGMSRNEIITSRNEIICP